MSGAHHLLVKDVILNKHYDLNQKVSSSRSSSAFECFKGIISIDLGMLMGEMRPALEENVKKISFFLVESTS
jgi:hypothetical protein